MLPHDTIAGGSSHEESSAAARLRRNGMPSSCENCRIAKARCDHNSPCGRCSRQGKQCYFHPAPMSHSPGNSTKKARLSSSSNIAEPVKKRRSSSNTQNPLTLSTGGTAGYYRKSSALSFGYMGSTSYAAILEENRAGRLWDEVHEATDDNEKSAMQAEKFALSILGWLPPQDMCERLLNVELTEMGVDFIFRPRRVRHYMVNFWDEYGQYLREPQQQQGMRQVCLALNNNTRKPLPVPANNDEFISSFCGPNSRWEVLGEFFLTIGWAVFSLPESTRFIHELVPEEVDRKSFACSMLECADACLILSDDLASTSNILAAHLLSRCVQLQSVIVGDSSYDLWKRVGHLVAAVTGLGLHLKPSPAESRSSLYHETRNRVLYSAFAIDKDLATFLGRPSMLSRHYISVEIPMDVSDSMIWEESDLSVLRQNVDSAGWNKQGGHHVTTQQRAMLQLRYLRDEILELSLVTVKPRNLGDRIDDLRQRIEDCYRGFPAVYHEPLHKTFFATRSSWDILAISQVQLTHLHNIFLCERIQHEGRDESRLLQSSRGILDIVNTFWAERDRYPKLRDFCHWKITNFGIPAASALAIDLWKQTSATDPKPPALNRPQVIQSLYIFVASLEWVDETLGNFKLCHRIKGLLNDILDRVLSPQSQDALPFHLPSFSTWDESDFSLAGMPNFGVDFESMDGFFGAPLMN